MLGGKCSGEVSLADAATPYSNLVQCRFGTSWPLSGRRHGRVQPYLSQRTQLTGLSCGCSRTDGTSPSKGVGQYPMGASGRELHIAKWIRKSGRRDGGRRVKV